MRCTMLAVVVVGTCGLAILTPRTGSTQHYLPTAELGFPRLKFGDSLVSLNDRCVVSRTKLNTRVRPVYVSGQPVGFC